MRTEWFFASVFVAVGALAGCPGELDETKFTDGGTTAACTDAPKDVFAVSCVSGCHSKAASASSGDLDLESPDIASRLVGQKAKGGPGLLIDPADIDKSVMLTKLKSPPPFGARMPFGSDALTDAKIKCVRDWLAAQVKTTGDAGTSTDSGGATDAASD